MNEWVSKLTSVFAAILCGSLAAFADNSWPVRRREAGLQNSNPFGACASSGSATKNAITFSNSVPPSGCLHFGNALRHRRQRRKIRIRLGLIPITRGEEVVAAIIAVPVLDRVLQIMPERHGIVAMPAVTAIPSSGS